MRTLPTLRQQGFAVAGLGAAALALLVFAGSQSRSQPGPAPGAHFVPSSEQLRSFAVQTVVLRTFRTEIVTDGYVAPGGGKANSLPVLPAQATDMLQAENDLASAQVQYRNAAAAQDRQHKLYLSEGAALKDWQQSQADLATAASAVASARNRLRLMGRADAGKAGAFTLADTSVVWLVANVREADAAQVRIGDPLTANLPVLSGRALAGQVAFISSVIDPVTHRLAIGARVTNPGGLLKPNMLATLTILGGEARQAPAVPQACVLYDGDQAHVWVIGAGRQLSSRVVSLGRSSGGFTEILAGVKAGEHVATAGGLFIDQAMSSD